MNPRQILQHIDDGANHFLFTLADAPHMTRTDDHGITIIQPKPGEEGISFVCNLALAGPDAAEASALIRRAKSFGFPVWFPLLATDAQFADFFGRERLHSAPLAADDEVYMAMRPGEMTPGTPAFPVVHADALPAFADCAHVANTVLADGRPDLHPIHHAPLMQAGRIHCYVLYADDQPVSAAVTMAQAGIVSLELVATMPGHRRRGYADAVCRQAVQDAWARGAQLLTVRAVNSAAARIYEKLGFRVYNHAL